MNLNARKTPLCFLFIAFSFFFSSHALTFSAPPPGKYELYDGTGNKTGDIQCRLSTATLNDQIVNELQIQTRLIYPSLGSDYKFEETEVAQVGREGLLTFRRETNDNGKKTITTGERQGTAIFIFQEKEGKKITTLVPVSTFDLSEYEMDLPSSPFFKLEKGQSKSYRVFFVEKYKAVQVSRNVLDLMNLPSDKKGKTPVIVVSTLMEGQATTSWFHQKSHVLLQEEGPRHLMSRIGE